MNDKYAFLMINYETPDFIKELHNKFTDDEIYNNENNEYGIEKETHVTLVPCLDNNCNLEDIKKLLLPLKKYEIALTNISCFNNDEYDVLKCDANSDYLNKTNKDITNKYKTYTEFKDYKPHLTIAYLKKGNAKKYTKDCLDNIIILKPKSFNYSFYDKEGNRKNIFFK